MRTKSQEFQVPPDEKDMFWAPCLRNMTGGAHANPSLPYVGDPSPAAWEPFIEQVSFGDHAFPEDRQDHYCG